jgi:hypothetical protein
MMCADQGNASSAFKRQQEACVVQESPAGTGKCPQGFILS